MKARRVISILLAVLMLLCVFTGCSAKEPVKGVNLDGPNKGSYDVNEKEGSNGNDLVGMAGTQLSTYDGYIGHGYDVINSPYYASNYIKRYCVLDTDKMAADGVIYEDRRVGTAVFSSYSGETLSSFAQNFNASAGASVKGLFSASMTTDFGISSSVNEKTAFAKGMAFAITKNQALKQMTIKKLLDKKYVDTTFLENLKDEAISPEELFIRYGTHIMLEVNLGGRLEMNFVYNNVGNKSTSEINVMVNGSYATVSGTATAKNKSDHASLTENSSFNLKTYGGDISLDMQTFEKAQSNMKAWLKSIKNGEEVFIKGGNLNSKTEMCPIWMFLTDEKYEARYKQIEEEYNRMLEESGSLLDNAVAKTIPQYIKNVYIGVGKTWQAAESDLISQSRERMYVIYSDLNSGAKGDYVLLGYTITFKPEEALRNIIFRTEWDAPSTWSGWAMQTDGKYKEVNYTKLLYDCNSRVGGEYIWLNYTHDAWAGDPISDLYVEINDNRTGKSGNTNWEVALCYNLGGKMELNMGADGNEIHLWVRRQPVETE